MVVRPLHVSVSTIESVDNSLAALCNEDVSSEDCEHNLYTLTALNTELTHCSI